MKRTKKNFKTFCAYALVLTIVFSCIGSLGLVAFADGLQGTGVEGDPYLIGSKADLDAFRAKVNGDEPGAWGKLTADVFMGGFDPNYGMGTSAQPYTGTFDGNGKTVTYAAQGGATGKGFFDYTKGATIKNLVLAGTNSSTGNSGAVVGVAEGGTFSNIISSVELTANGQGNVGGLIGQASAAITMDRCGVTGNVTGGMYQSNIGGLIGNNHAYSVITNSFVSGNVNGGNPGCGLSAVGEFTNCYFSGDMINAWARRQATNAGTCTNVYVNSDYVVTGGGTHSNNNGGGTSKTAQQFRSGEVAYLLNQGDADGDGKADNAFGQSIGTDATPVLLAADNSNAVIESKMSGHYNNAPEGTVKNPYVISDITNLNEFKAIAEAGEEEASAVLESDIATSFVNGSAYIIGTYKGTFDGNGHSISLNIGGGNGNKGLFANLNGATVKNLTITGAVLGLVSNFGSVCAAAVDSVIENCVNEAEVASADTNKGVTNCGGIAGNISGNSKVSNCVNKGNINKNNLGSYAGGIAGLSTADVTFENCYNTAPVMGMNYVAGLSWHGTFKNCYSVGNVTSDYGVTATSSGKLENVYRCSDATVSSVYVSPALTGKAASTSDYTSGKVAYLLGETFGQAIGTDTYPVLATAENKVYTDGTSFTNTMPSSAFVYSDERGIEIIGSSDANGKLIVAAYDGAVLTDILTLKDVSIENGKITKEDLPTAENNQTIKVFLWSDLINVSPLGVFTKIEL